MKRKTSKAKTLKAKCIKKMHKNRYERGLLNFGDDSPGNFWMRALLFTGAVIGGLYLGHRTINALKQSL